MKAKNILKKATTVLKNISDDDVLEIWFDHLSKCVVIINNKADIKVTAPTLKMAFKEYFQHCDDYLFQKNTVNGE